VSHSRDHIISHKIIEGLDDAEVRPTLTTKQCALVDRLRGQEDLSARDKRKLLRCTADVLFDDGED
jgi:hypothetical protein